MAPNLLVSDQFNLTVCINWKTGSSSLRSILLQNSGLESWDEAEVISNDLQELSKFPLSGIRYRLQHYFNIIMVRHPLDRLVSAYNDKLNMDKEYRQRLGKLIIDRDHLNVSKSEYASGKGVSFKQFIDFILEGGRDPHWDSYSKKCLPCLLPYNYLMRTETMDEDLRYIINYKLSGKGRNVKERHWRPPARNNRLLHEYESVPDKLVEEISKKYKADMAIFGYDVERSEKGVKARCKVVNADCC